MAAALAAVAAALAGRSGGVNVLLSLWRGGRRPILLGLRAVTTAMTVTYALLGGGRAMTHAFFRRSLPMTTAGGRTMALLLTCRCDRQ